MPVRRHKPEGFRFDPTVGRYRSPRSGRYVAAAEIRRAVEAVIQKSARRVEALSGQLRAGSLTLDEWALALRAESKSSHLAAALAAKGGREAMTQGDYGALGQRLRREYQYLARFTEQIAAGSLPLDGRFTRRAASYALASRAVFSEAERQARMAAGDRFERNLLTPGESCESCKAATAAGLVPIGSLPPIGSRTCLHNCRCQIVYQRSA